MVEVEKNTLYYELKRGMNLKQVFTFIIVFIAGFILGEMDTEPIINNIGREIAQMNIISIIGLISSITTLLVF